jgi:hypothetical protein
LTLTSTAATLATKEAIEATTASELGEDIVYIEACTTASATEAPARTIVTELVVLSAFFCIRKYAIGLVYLLENLVRSRVVPSFIWVIFNR